MKIDKEKFRFYLLVFLLIILLIFCSYMYLYFKTECKVVEENPLIYSAKKYDANQCYCYLNNDDVIFFNQSNARIQKNLNDKLRGLTLP